MQRIESGLCARLCVLSASPVNSTRISCNCEIGEGAVPRSAPNLALIRIVQSAGTIAAYVGRVWCHWFWKRARSRMILMRKLIPSIIFLVLGTTHVPTTYIGLTYEIETRDGQFRLVMLAPWPVLEDAVAPVDAASGYIPYSQLERTKELRTKYSRSGLYRNDGSSTPLWTVDWYSQSVAISSDGVNLSSLNDGTVSGLSVEALTFYENGEEIRRYIVGDLVRSIKELSLGFEGYWWLEGFAFDDDNTLVVTLVNKDRFSFDIRTGNIIRIERDPRKLYVGFLVGIALLLLIIGGWIVVRRF